MINTEKQRINSNGNSNGNSRNNVVGRPFSKGISGNPNGRPKKEKTFSDTAAQLLASSNIQIKYEINGREKEINLKSDKNIYWGLVSALILQGLKGDVRAIKELIDRTEGKAVQKLDIEGSLETNIPDLSHLGRGDLEKLYANLSEGNS
ncbi:hypothetical protein LCGC14_0405710 [marine sediment metagenome]|uniref:DUF5681 domain-containing protein n=1 Tax=marine sediment metagenome TaxID=412755 RepID=A0A0F9TDK2_9ZZZZ|nr:hypothetical protein [archaeon]